MHGNHPQTARSSVCWNQPAFVLHACDPCRRCAGGRNGMDAHTHTHRPGSIPGRTRTVHHPVARACPCRDRRVDWTTWWPWRGAYTRSHPELGREIPQRPWYCVLRHGRVGRRQVFQSTLYGPPGPHFSPPGNRGDPTTTNAGWSSPVARQAHNLKVIGSNPIPATKFLHEIRSIQAASDTPSAGGVLLPAWRPSAASRLPAR